MNADAAPAGQGRGDAAREFSVLLRELYEAAGSPPLKLLADQARRQTPPMRLSPSTLSDWLAGKTVPADPAALRFLVVYLQSRVRRFPSGASVTPVETWLALHRRARERVSVARSGRRARAVQQVEMPASAARDLRDLLYGLYLRAGAPALTGLHAVVRESDDLPGAPSRDTIHRVISGRVLPASSDAVAVAMALARLAGADPDDVGDQARSLWAAAARHQAAPPPDRLGRPLAECDPFALQVHRTLEPAGPGEPLPPYLRRAFDDRLEEIVDRARDGVGVMVSVVGPAGCGKTRAIWEALRRLSPEWRVWHPYDAASAAAAIGDVGPCTAVWLDESQLYFDTTDPALGERVATGLRTLLADRSRSPVLVLATMQPETWVRLAERPDAASTDHHPQARHLLTASTILDVPDSFTPAELAAANGIITDPRLSLAVAHAEGGRVTQILASAPKQLRRYRTAPPAARAVLDAAIDARRRGHPAAIPQRLLEQSAPGYLDDHDWDTLPDDWFAQALTYLAQPVRPTGGLLTRVRPRSGDEPDRGREPYYRLADYLTEIGPRAGADEPVPGHFRTAAALATTHLRRRDEPVDHDSGRPAAHRFETPARSLTAARLGGDATGVCARPDGLELASDEGEFACFQLKSYRADVSAAELKSAFSSELLELLARNPNRLDVDTVYLYCYEILQRQRSAGGDAASGGAATGRQHRPDQVFAPAVRPDLTPARDRVLWSGRSAVAEYAFDEPNSLPRWTLPEDTEVQVLDDRITYRDPATGAAGELRWSWPQHLRVQPGSRTAGTAAQVQLVCAGPGDTFPALVLTGGALTTVRDADRLANVLRQAIARYRVTHATTLGIPEPQVRMLSRQVTGPEFTNHQRGEGQTVLLPGSVPIDPQAAAAARPTDAPVADSSSDLAARAAELAARVASLVATGLEGHERRAVNLSAYLGHADDYLARTGGSTGDRADRVRRTAARLAANSARGHSPEILDPAPPAGGSHGAERAGDRGH